METAINDRPKFNRRAFISLSMAVTALILPVSGIMLHSVSDGPLTAERHFWMGVHNMTAFLFTVFTFLHIVINKKALGGYIRKVKTTVITREALMSLGMVLLLVGLFALHGLHGR